MKIKNTKASKSSPWYSKNSPKVLLPANIESAPSKEWAFLLGSDVLVQYTPNSMWLFRLTTLSPVRLMILLATSFYIAFFKLINILENNNFNVKDILIILQFLFYFKINSFNQVSAKGIHCAAVLFT